MPTIVRVKRSTTLGDPATLGAGELAHSALAGLQNNGGDRVYIGVGTETAGNAANHHVIGGKYFTDMLDHVHGTVTASSALIVGSTSKLDVLNVDNVTLDGNTVSTTDTNGNLILNPNGTGKVSIANAFLLPRVDGTSNQFLRTDGAGVTYWSTVATTLSVSGNSGTDTVAIGTDTLNFTGTTGITSVVTDNTVTLGFVSPGTAGNLLTSNGSSWTSSAPATNGTVTSVGFTGGVISIATATTTPALTVAGTSGGIPYFTSGTTWATSAALAANALLVGGGSGVAPSTVTTGANVVTALGVAVGSAGSFVVNGGALGTPSSGTLTNCSGLLVTGGGTGTSTGSITGTGALTFTAGGTNTNVNLAPNGTGIVDVGGKRVGNAADPTQSTDLATKAYVDGLANGLDVKASVRVVTTANITLSNTQTIDGVALSVGDRVLVKDQSTGSQNGIYVVASGSWTRAADFDNSPGTEVSPGAFTFIEEGTVGANNGYVCTNSGSITIGTTAITFVQFSGAGQITAGDGLTKNGNTIDVVGTAGRITVNVDSVDISTSYVGQNSITTLGTIGTGTWQGGVVGGTYGGTGVNNGASTVTIAGSLTHAGAFTQSFTATANTAVTLPTTGTLATLTGSESLSNKTITSSSFNGTTLAASGAVTLTSTTDASALGTAAVILSGGLSIAKSIFAGINITGSGASTSNLDGFNIDGGTY